MPPTEAWIRVRRARDRDALDVRRVLDAAMLAYGRLDERIRSGEVLVAVEEEGGSERDERPVLGALVLSGDEIEAVAVRRSRRDRGIGRALVERAAEGRAALEAEFDPDSKAFYEALGFEVERVGENRFRSVLRYDP